MVDWRRVLPYAWSLALALLMLGPALGSGYVLSYDMVWVPDLALRHDSLGFGSGLPRAVPSDAVVSVLDELLPGMVLQKLMLLAVLTLGGVGAVRLTDRSSLTAQLVAVALYQWNPFVAERLVIGHWPLLVAYATLPWVVLAAQRWRATGELPTRLWWLVPVGSLSASAGVATAFVLVAFAASRSARRLCLTGVLVLVANAPWVVSGLLHAGSAMTDPLGADAFALRGEGSMPAPVAALSLGGIWNAEVVPDSRAGWAGWASVVLLVALVVIGFRRWSEAAGRRDVLAFAACWLTGFAAAVVTWLAPDQVAWVVAHVPGAGILRDGSRMLVLCVPLLAAAGGYGAARIVGLLVRGARPAGAVALLLASIAVLPDAAFGVSGRLSPAEYPADYQRARDAMTRAPEAGDVLLLPLSSYRQPRWNEDHKVLDPAGRFLEPDFVAGDDLYVSGVRIAGEDPRVRQVGRVLAAPTPERRSEGLADLGIAYVVTEKDAGAAPPVAGAALFTGSDLLVQTLDRPRARSTPPTWRVAMACAWSLFAGSLIGGTLGAVRFARRRGRR